MFKWAQTKEEFMNVLFAVAGGLKTKLLHHLFWQIRLYKLCVNEFQKLRMSCIDYSKM